LLGSNNTYAKKKPPNQKNTSTLKNPPEISKRIGYVNNLACSYGFVVLFINALIK
jgi:hypothetical protein